jgi:glycine/D-amino acid oxidase-like deaminating enzyme
MQRASGLDDVAALSPAEVIDRFPWVSCEAIVGGTWCPSDGFLLPDRIYQDAMNRVRELGGDVRQRAMVAGSRDAGGRLTAVDTGKGMVEGDLFIDCTNAWTNRTAGMMGAEVLPVDPLKRYLWFLLREGSMSADTLATMPLVVAPSGIYVRPENRDSLMMGKKHDTRPEPQFSYDDQDHIEARYSHKTGIDAVPFEHWMSISEVLPPLGEFGGITATTAGYYGTTPDHNPFLDFDRQIPNLIRLVGFSGHGAMFGPFSARVCLALANAGTPISTMDLYGQPIDLGAFKIGRDFDSHETMVI